MVLPEWRKQKKYVNPYYFIEILSEELDSSSTIIADDGAHLTWAVQAFKVKKGQRFFSAFGNSPMGYALPAAIGASIGSAAACKSAQYTQRKKDKESGAATKATLLINALDVTPLLKAADDDAAAYADLQRTWKKESDMSAEEKEAIESRALAIPTKLLEVCHEHILQIYEFLPHCNTNITSDAKVGIHQLAGAARAAYQVSGKSC